MLPMPLSTSKLIVPLVTRSKNAFTHMRTQGAYLYHTLLTGSHVEFCGGNAQKLFSGQGLNQVHIFNQGMTRQQPIHTQWTLNSIPDVSSFLLIPGAVSAIG
jgi:hypothetical protein